MEEEADAQDLVQPDLVDLTADLVAAYVSNNRVPPGEMPALLASVHAAVSGLGRGQPEEKPDEKATPAQIRKSIKPDGLISFIDGKSYKTLKRHLTKHGITMEQYRERFGLPRDYPSTAASYSEQRSKLALALGLGNRTRNAAPKVAELAETVADSPKTRGRKKTAEPGAAPAEKPARARKPKTAAAAK